MKRKFSFVLILVFAVSLLLTACGASAPATAAKNSDVVVLYTNDVHCAADGYVAVAQTKAALEAAGKEVVLLKDAGDGFSMLSGGELLLDSIMLDNQGLITYITENLEGTVGSDYADPYGQGRINIIQ